MTDVLAVLLPRGLTTGSTVRDHGWVCVNAQATPQDADGGRHALGRISILVTAAVTTANPQQRRPLTCVHRSRMAPSIRTPACSPDKYPPARRPSSHQGRGHAHPPCPQQGVQEGSGRPCEVGVSLLPSPAPGAWGGPRQLRPGLQALVPLGSEQGTGRPRASTGDPETGLSWRRAASDKARGPGRSPQPCSSPLESPQARDSVLRLSGGVCPGTRL